MFSCKKGKNNNLKKTNKNNDMMILMIFKMAKIILKWLKNYYDDIFRISRLLQVFCRPVFFSTLNQISLTCGMMVSCDRRSCSPIAAISKPSIRIRPPALSRIRNKAKVRVDLPAPVRPTIPTCFARKKRKDCENIMIMINHTKGLRSFLPDWRLNLARA